MSRRKFEIIYFVAVTLTLLPVIFPVFEIANRAEPIILGLPFGFFWVILWIVIAFITVTILYAFDPNKDEQEE
ncbi:DUF3311 domain-containing protein [Virgibacillus ihumii]|uniref:DUF3311 domain-containing protein n=1 Tax=Virgibacillus ihumii TaxID=2686091 RepID=UPI00157E05A7|nr:DUF3311 domain-containing protein [Virgibacillus ihumii]